MRPGEALSEPMEKDAFLDYELMIYICEGTEAEELEWFQVINIASEPLSAQKLRNAIYSGTWLTSAKEYFSKPNSGGKKAIKEEEAKPEAAEDPLITDKALDVREYGS